MFHLFRYRIPNKYASEFKDTYSYINLKQVAILSTVVLLIAFGVRAISIFYQDDLVSMPNLINYNILNWLQISVSTFFLVTSNIALKSRFFNTAGRNALVILFCICLLTSSFTVSYLFSLSNPKNTLTIFLAGVVAVSIFFSLELKHIIIISIYIVLMFVAAMIIPSISNQQKLLNIIMSGVLAFFLYSCSRYGYYFKAEQFVKVKQLEEKNIEVQKLNHQKSEILAFVAHDLRNPLNNIEALSRIMLEEEQYLQSTELQLVLSSARQAKNIINDLLEVVQEQRVPLLLAKTDMVNYLKSITEVWQANAEKERTITFKTDEKELFTTINSSKFTRVIDNLIGNGLKFSRPDTPINVVVSKTDKECILWIKDFGIGIPDHLQSSLFDPFSKSGRPGLKGEKSIGLGLHISRQIIEQHQGTLTVESRENEGTTFVIALPLAG